MIESNKNLLLKDLSSRLPYGVKVYDIKSSINSSFMNLNHVNGVGEVFISYKLECRTALIEDVKPYLFPLSSMTEEQLIELKEFTDLKYEHNTLELVEWEDNCKTLEFWLEEIPSYCVIKVFDWLNKNHFDYRGLIEKGLAIDATGLNIY
jgi:hypothetical protein